VVGYFDNDIKIFQNIQTRRLAVCPLFTVGLFCFFFEFNNS